jgi:hypothetical protein
MALGEGQHQIVSKVAQEPGCLWVNSSPVSTIKHETGEHYIIGHLGGSELMVKPTHKVGFCFREGEW